jgi:hypothetical protein
MRRKKARLRWVGKKWAMRNAEGWGWTGWDGEPWRWRTRETTRDIAESLGMTPIRVRVVVEELDE